MPIRTEPWPAGTPCWLDIGVPDMNAAQEFYGAIMGWDFDDKGPEFGNYVIASRNGADAAGIGPQQSPDQPVAWMLYLASDDARATATAVAANRGQVLMEPMEMPGLGDMFIAMDPQGAAFGVWQAKGNIGAGLYNEPGGLVWEQLTVPDAEAAREFYGALFPLEFSAQDGGVMMRRPGEEENIGGISSGTDRPPGWLCYFAVDDAVKAEATVLERGGTVVTKVEPTEWGGLGVVADPFGAVFGIGDSKQA